MFPTTPSSKLVILNVTAYVPRPAAQPQKLLTLALSCLSSLKPSPKLCRKDPIFQEQSQDLVSEAVSLVWGESYRSGLEVHWSGILWSGALGFIGGACLSYFYTSWKSTMTKAAHKRKHLTGDLQFQRASLLQGAWG